MNATRIALTNEAHHRLLTFRRAWFAGTTPYGGTTIKTLATDFVAFVRIHSLEDYKRGVEWDAARNISR